MVRMSVDVLQSLREILYRLRGHYTLIQDKFPIRDGNCYLVESSAQESSRGNVLRVDVSQLAVQGQPCIPAIQVKELGLHRN